MVGSASSDFSDLVIAGKELRIVSKIEKIQGVIIVSNGAKKPYSRFTKKKEWETNTVMIAKGNTEAYQVPYYQVADIAPNQYPQEAYTILIG